MASRYEGWKESGGEDRGRAAPQTAFCYRGAASFILPALGGAGEPGLPLVGWSPASLRPGCGAAASGVGSGAGVRARAACLGTEKSC